MLLYSYSSISLLRPEQEYLWIRINIYPLMTDILSSIHWKNEWASNLLARFLERTAPPSLKRLKATWSLKRKGLPAGHSMIASIAESVRLIITSAVPATITAIAAPVVNVPLFVNDMRKRYALFSLNLPMFAMDARRSTTALWKSICTMLTKHIWST